MQINQEITRLKYLKNFHICFINHRQAHQVKPLIYKSRHIPFIHRANQLLARKQANRWSPLKSWSRTAKTHPMIYGKKRTYLLFSKLNPRSLSPVREGDEEQQNYRYMSKIHMFLLKKDIDSEKVSTFCKEWFRIITYLSNNLYFQPNRKNTIT